MRREAGACHRRQVTSGDSTRVRAAAGVAAAESDSAPAQPAIVLAAHMRVARVCGILRG